MNTMIGIDYAKYVRTRKRDVVSRLLEYLRINLSTSFKEINGEVT